MATKLPFRFAAAFAASLALLSAPVAASAEDNQTQELHSSFDSVLGTELRSPQSFETVYSTDFERQVAQLAEGSKGRIGVYAIDLSSGRELAVMADQRFPMASTSKVAIAATYLAGVDAGKWSLSSEWRLPRPGGSYMSADQHLRLMIAKSCNACTDALLNAVGGPRAVNEFMRSAGITDFQLSRDIATLVREDGQVDPAWSVDLRDSATPRAMGQLLAGIYQGKWLSASSRSVLMNAMRATTTGDKRMRSAVPLSANLAHKTGTLSRTASDIGFFHTPDGRPVAVAIYVTGQSPSMAAENGNRGVKLEARQMRDARISTITGALYRGFSNLRADARSTLEAKYGS